MQVRLVVPPAYLTVRSQWHLTLSDANDPQGLMRRYALNKQWRQIAHFLQLFVIAYLLLTKNAPRHLISSFYLVYLQTPSCCLMVTHRAHMIQQVPKKTLITGQISYRDTISSGVCTDIYRYIGLYFQL